MRCICFFLALLGYAEILHSYSYRFTPVADASVKSTRPDQNFGRKGKLRVDGSPVQISYMRFHATGIVGIVNSARLRVYVYRGNADGFSVRAVSASWDEELLTYENRPSLGNTIGASGPLVDEAWVEIPLSLLPGANGVLSFAFTATNRQVIRLYSSESNSPPELLVETTVPANPVIAAAGDISCDPASDSFNDGDGTATACHMRATSDLLLDRSDLVSVLLLGDNQYEEGTLQQYNASFDLSWGRVKKVIQPAPGNHEYNTPDAKGYYDYFGAAAGDKQKGYYSFNIGSWHVVALNSNCAEIGGCGAGSPQEKWLRADLAANSATCTLAYWHHPRYSSGLHGSSSSVAPLWQALYDANAEVVLSGHDHDYERFAPQDASGISDSARGIRQFVVGTGGKTLYEFGATAPNSQVRRNDAYGVLILTLQNDRYSWSFLTENSTSSDSGTTLCH